MSNELGTFVTIFSAILGGSLCAFSLHIANKRKERMELTFKVIEKKDALIESIEDSFNTLKYHLNSNGIVHIPLGEEDDEEKTKTYKEKFDTVVTVGDFLNMVSFLYLSWKVNYRIIRQSELYNVLLVFIYLLEKHNFQIQIYDYESPTPQEDYIYKDWRIGWTFLHDFYQSRECRFMRNPKYRWNQFFELFL